MHRGSQRRIKLPTALRGYSGPHTGLRRRLARVVRAGGVRCARGAGCFFAEVVDGVRVGGLIRPDEAWHLGHDDFDRTLYSGPEHVRCNCATAGRRSRRVSVRL
jgi:hypothetical protein